MEKPNMRYTPEELELIRHTYSGDTGEALIKLLRKTFIPELDPALPIGQMIDVFMSIPVENQTTEQIISNLRARNILIGHLELMLQQLKALANSSDESAEEQAKRLMKNSSK